MADKALLKIGELGYELPVVIGTEAEPAVDIAQLRAQSGYITLDDGYGNTGSCESKITFIDGERGILRAARRAFDVHRDGLPDHLR
jgi:citrate synthase